jgi:TM2 domain-containing membrane protein YozV
MSTWPGEETARYQTRENTQAAEGELVAPQPPQIYGHGQQVAYQQVQPRSAALAVVASFFVPGLGSMINDRIGKGLLILACQIVASILCLVVVGFVLAPAVWIYGMIAANNDVRAWNQKHGIVS